MIEKLTSSTLSRMTKNSRPKVFRFDTAAQFESARQNAYFIRRNCPRKDGMRYKISTSVKAMVITISLVP